jgi:hypothetical protein
MPLVGELQKLLLRLSDGQWEHGPGISISTIDNPGWRIDICLTETPHINLFVGEVADNRSEVDWIFIRTEMRGFQKFLMVACGPDNLEEALSRIFLLLEGEKPVPKSDGNPEQ